MHCLQGILSDLFPGITLPEHDYGKLQSGIIEAMEKRGLQVIMLDTSCTHMHKADDKSVAIICLYTACRSTGQQSDSAI